MKIAAARPVWTQRLAPFIVLGLCWAGSEAYAGKLTHRTLNVLEAVKDLHVTYPALVEHYKANPYKKLKLWSRGYAEGASTTISSMNGGGGPTYFANLFLGTKPSGTFQLAELREKLENQLKPRIRVVAEESYLDEHYPLFDVDKLDQRINEALAGRGKYVTMPEDYILVQKR